MPNLLSKQMMTELATTTLHSLHLYRIPMTISLANYILMEVVLLLALQLILWHRRL
jgi:hypothetical protein